LELLKKNEQLTMNELAFDMKQKYPTFDITPQHLGHVIRDNNQIICYKFILRNIVII
jgi:hypothetical protein